MYVEQLRKSHRSFFGGPGASRCFGACARANTGGQSPRLTQEHIQWVPLFQHM